MCDRGFDEYNDHNYDTIAAETIDLLQNEPVSYYEILHQVCMFNVHGLHATLNLPQVPP